MHDSIFLLLASISLALAAWGFWIYLGESGFFVVSTLALVTAIADNLRLRRLLRNQQPTQQAR